LNLAPKVYEESTGPAASTQTVAEILAPLNAAK